jgi:hypothetical protein
MALNRYFQNGSSAEQNLYESLVIESIQIHGIDVYYIPRKIIKRDFVLNEDVISSFDKAFKIEMYVEEMEGFEGDSKIYEKFGLEVRDELTLRVAKCRWNQLIGRHGYTNDAVRPREGDLIYVPLYKSIFEIRYSDSKKPFYQLQDLPLFTLTCEKFEYEGQEIDTGLDDIDDIQEKLSQGFTFVIDSKTEPDFISGETLTFTLPDGITGSTEFFEYNTVPDSDPIIEEMRVGTLTFDDGYFHNIEANTSFLGNDSGGTCIINETRALDDSDSDIFNADHWAANATFAEEASNLEFIDFSESNPFGEPFNFE